MKLESKCKNCGKYIEFTENVSDRVELNLERGKSFELFCKNCATESCYHPNDIKAKKNRVVSMIGFLIFIIGTFLIYHFIGEFYLEHKEQFESKKNYSSFGRILGAFAIPFIIFLLIENSQMKNVRRFNSYKIKD